MQRGFIAILAMVVALAANTSSAAASEVSAVVGIIQKYVEAGNRLDRRTYAALCANDAVIFDIVPPYEFRGPTACLDEWDAGVRWETRNKIVDNGITLSKPAYIDVAGDHAYVVFRATNSLTRSGRKEVLTGNWTFVLRRQAPGWRITGWTWDTLGFTPRRSSS